MRVREGSGFEQLQLHALQLPLPLRLHEAQGKDQALFDVPPEDAAAEQSRAQDSLPGFSAQGEEEARVQHLPERGGLGPQASAAGALLQDKGKHAELRALPRPHRDLRERGGGEGVQPAAQAKRAEVPQRRALLHRLEAAATQGEQSDRGVEAALEGAQGRED